MSARMNCVMRALSATTGTLLLFFTQATAGEPSHAVRGHAVFTLDPPAAIEQISINAWTDENGIAKGSLSVFPSVFLLGLLPPTPVVPDLAGWTWVIRLTSLEVNENVARTRGVVVFDNRVPESTIGCLVDFTITDNGSGNVDQPDVLGGNISCAGAVVKTILAGNFTVR